MSRPHSIRTRLLAFTALLLLLVAAGQLVFGLFLARPYFLRSKKAEMEDFFTYLRSNYSDNTQQLYELLRPGEDGDNIRVLIHDGRRVVYTSRPMDINVPDAPPLPALSDQTFSTEPEAVELPFRGEESMLCLTGRFSYGGGERYVVLWVMVESVESSIALFNRFSLLILAFVLAVGAAAGILLARSIARPIREIRTVSRQVADLDFTARADESSSIRELAELAGSVNRMAGHLSAAVEELRLANAALQRDVDRQRQLDQMRREFVANVSHEMKTPLCLLQMYAENLKNGVPGIDREEYCDIIVDEVQRLNQMVGSMLELSSIENGLASMRQVPLELGALCRDTLARMAPVLAEYQVEGPGPEQTACVLGDAQYLEMALSNYLSNAAAHTPQSGRIAVTLACMDGFGQVTVFNQGQPIPEDRLGRVWDSFYKVDEARTRTEQMHAGLGLSIVKNIIQHHRGSCAVENRTDGVAFSFRLPLDETT